MMITEHHESSHLVVYFKENLDGVDIDRIRAAADELIAQIERHCDNVGSINLETDMAYQCQPCGKLHQWIPDAKNCCHSSHPMHNGLNEWYCASCKTKSIPIIDGLGAKNIRCKNCNSQLRD